MDDVLCDIVESHEVVMGALAASVRRSSECILISVGFLPPFTLVQRAYCFYDSKSLSHIVVDSLGLPP